MEHRRKWRLFLLSAAVALCALTLNTPNLGATQKLVGTCHRCFDNNGNQFSCCVADCTTNCNCAFPADCDS